jgi:hypothetical protein
MTSNDSNPVVPANTTGAGAISAACCETSDAASAAACALCGRPICKHCRCVVNMKFTCASCRDQVVAELSAEKAGVARLPAAVGGGIVAAVLAGAAWAIIAVVTKMEIGFAAVGVGYLAGWGVFLGARKKKGTQLQWIAVGCAVLGLLLGKYFIVAHEIVTNIEVAKDWSLVDPRIVRVFFSAFTEFLSPWDALWTFFAFGAAWKVPKPTQIKVR